LRGKDRGDEQLQRTGKIQLAVRIGINALQRGNDFLRAASKRFLHNAPK